MADHIMHVHYIGRQTINSPQTPNTIAGPSTSSSSSPALPTTDSQLQEAFVAFIQRELEKLQEEGKAGTRGVEFRKAYCISLIVVKDAAFRVDQLKIANWISLGRPPLPGYFWVAHSSIHHSALVIEDAWTCGATEPSKAQEEHDAQDSPHSSSRLTSSTTRKARPADDRKAQRMVPDWYANRCVLSGMPLPDAAHIVPVRTTQTRSSGLWLSLQLLLGASQIEEWTTVGKETTNILPLNAATHRQWDRYKFALRPIEDATDPQHRIRVQVVWIDVDVDQGSHQRDHYALGGFVDFRRPDASGLFPAVEHGDVYEITTSDPEKRPLPSLRMLRTQYGAHRLMAGMRAAGILRQIFSGDPPQDDGASESVREDDVPAHWRSLLDAAVEKGVLENDTAYQWKVAFAQKQRREMQQSMKGGSSEQEPD